MEDDRQQISRPEKLEQFLASDPHNPILIRDLARAYEIEGKAERALALYRQLLNLEGTSPALISSIGLLLMRLERWAEATEYFREATSHDPSAAPLWFNLGYAEFMSGDTNSSREHFERAVTLAPDNPQFHYYLAIAHDTLGDDAAFRAAIQGTLSRDPNHAGARLLSAFSALGQGQIARAKTEVERLLRAHPRFQDGLILKAQLALIDFDAEEAIRILRPLQLQAPDNVDVNIIIGQSLLMLQRLPQARAAFVKVLSADQQSVPAHIGLGWISIILDELEKAEAHFTIASQQAPDDADGYAGLALVHLGRGYDKEAEQLADLALAHDPNNAPALMVHAALKEKSDNRPGAEQVVRQLFESHGLGPLGWNGKDILQRFHDSPTGKRVTAKIIRKVKRKQQQH